MTSDVPVEPGARPTEGRARAERAVLWFAVLFPILAALAPRGLWAPDEPRYGQVARETLRDGRWIVPHVNGEPYAEKPPVFFAWVAALSAPFGEVDDLLVRLAGAIAAAGATLLVARLARRWFSDPSLGVTAAAMFASFVLVLWNSPRGGLDLPLTFFVLAAVERGSAWAAGGGAGAAALAGLAWAGGVLVKGPMGFLIPPIVLAGGMLASRARPGARDPGWWLAPLVTVAVLLAWLLPALALGGDAYGDRLLGQIAGRATGAEGHHIRPVWYYAERIAVWGMPWLLHLAAAAGTLTLVRRAPPGDRFGLGASLAGGLGILVLLTLFATKRELYMVPCLAFGALGAAYALHRGLFPRLLRAGVVLSAGTLVAGGLALAAAPFVLDRRLSDDVLPADPMSFGVLAPLGLAVAVFGTGAALAWRARRAPVAAARVAACSGLAAAVLAFHALFPLLDAVQTWKRAAAAADSVARGGPISCWGVGQAGVVLWDLPRRTTRDIEGLEDLGRTLDPAGEGGAVLAEERAWRDAQAAAASSDEPWARAVRSARTTWHRRVSRRMVLVLVPAPE